MLLALRQFRFTTATTTDTVPNRTGGARQRASAMLAAVRLSGTTAAFIYKPSKWAPRTLSSSSASSNSSPLPALPPPQSSHAMSVNRDSNTPPRRRIAPWAHLSPNSHNQTEKNNCNYDNLNKNRNNNYSKSLFSLLGLPFPGRSRFSFFSRRSSSSSSSSSSSLSSGNQPTAAGFSGSDSSSSSSSSSSPSSSSSSGPGLVAGMGSEWYDANDHHLNPQNQHQKPPPPSLWQPSSQNQNSHSKFLTLPTILTLGRVAAVPLLISTFYVDSWWGRTATTSIFIAAAVTDWLDGYLARKMRLGSAFGAFLDPVADKLMVAATLVLLCSKPLEVAMFGPVPWLLTVPSIAIIGREITMSAVREWAASQDTKLLEAVAVNNLGKWKTATQMTALTILLATRDSSLGGPGILVASGVALLYVSAGLSVWSLGVYMSKIWRVLMK